MDANGPGWISSRGFSWLGNRSGSEAMAIKGLFLGGVAATALLAVHSQAFAALFPDGAVDITTVTPPVQDVSQPAVITTYGDGTFTPGNWSTATFQVFNSAGITVGESQALSGGNPGAYYSFSGSLPVYNGSTQYLRQMHFTPNAVYHPATS